MEPQERIKDLIHLSLSKLKLEKSISIKLYFRSGREILRMANIYVEEDDEERAFQLYFRFVT
jgi:STAM-binding protein